ncbi:MAG: DUF3822 family protein [Bacteroidia bacterium]
MFNANYNIVKLVDEKITEQKNLQLKLLINENFIVVVVFNSDKVFKFFEIEITKPNLQPLQFYLDYIFENLLAHKNFINSEAFFLTEYFVILPNVIYAKEESENLLKFTTQFPSNYVTREDALHDFKIVYAINLDVKNYLEKTIKNIKFSSSAFGLLNVFLNKTEFTKTDALINFTASQMEVVLKTENKLQLYNLFKFNNDEDALYYVLFIIEQYNLNVLTCKFCVCGQIDKNESIVSKLKKYIKNVEIGSLNTNYFSSKHLYYSLIN